MLKMLSVIAVILAMTSVSYGTLKGGGGEDDDFIAYNTGGTGKAENGNASGVGEGLVRIEADDHLILIKNELIINASLRHEVDEADIMDPKTGTVYGRADGTLTPICDREDKDFQSSDDKEICVITRQELKARVAERGIELIALGKTGEDNDGGAIEAKKRVSSARGGNTWQDLSVDDYDYDGL